MRKIRFGIIGCGLMGREFGSAVARWCHLTENVATPEIVGVCDYNEAATKWFTDNFSSVKYVTADYTELLNKDDIDAIYCALPHNLHGKVYSDIIKAGKHLLGEKPFGIDAAANETILLAIAENPNVVVRCASEFPFFPACRELIKWINENRFGKIIEVRAGFNHSSDMDLTKPINWKRTIEINGEYGCMGDLGIHTQHIPFHVGWRPRNVYAVLSDIAKERPDGNGNTVPCKTWDNAVLVCDTVDKNGDNFPMFLETKRMSPGSTNEWFIEVYGLEASAKFNSNDPNAFVYTQAVGKEQAWCRLDIGYKPQFKTVTGSIFEFGFTDSILQMWCAFMKEVSGEAVEFGCFTPEETRLSHKLLTAALVSNREKRVVEL